MKARSVLLLMMLNAFVFLQLNAQTVIGRQNVDQFPSTAWGTPTYGLTWLPVDYATNPTQKYPLIIFLHGAGEGGTTVGSLNNLISTALPQHIANGWNPEAVNPVNGQNYKFIVVSPQAPGWSYAWGSIQWMLKDIVTRYRVDTTRIYVTGLSAGGAGSWSCYTNGPAAAQKFAAIIPVSSAGTNSPAEDAQIPLAGGTYGGKVWSVCGAADSWMSFANSSTLTFNNATPAPAVRAEVTGIPGADHNPSAWNTAYDRNWRNNQLGLNIFEWMLKYTRSDSALPPPNQPPTVSAGADQTISLPINTVTLSGTASDADGIITSYSWTQVSGPNTAVLTAPSAISTNANNLIAGTYVFRLTVTDNTTATASANVQVIVNGLPNVPPATNAGSDVAITLPTNAATLNGGATDADGTIASYQWNKIAGPSQFVVASPASAVTAINNLVQGVYQFELTATDNNSAATKDTVVVTVNAAPPPPNQLPVTNAGTDVTITLPTNTTTLNGSATDADGTIASYQWNKIAGPSQFVIASPATAVTAINNLVQGVYQFELVATDNSSAATRDTVVVTVNAAPPPPNQLPVTNAGTDQSITLPVDSVLLSGSAIDADGTIAFYQWTKINGPSSFSIQNATAAQTKVLALVAGTYKFSLAATDNSGAVTADTITVVVNNATPQPNQPPVANAGADMNIILPKDSVLLNGSGFEPEGQPINFVWTKISGPPNYFIVDATNKQSLVDSLTQGVYFFQLRVTDSVGAFGTDTVMITVLAPANQPPNVNAGADTTIRMPVDSIALNGAAVDTDGTIVAVKWTKISGPAQYTIADSLALKTIARGLATGNYQFALAGTDNIGAIAIDTMRVIVLPANKLPMVNAGPEQTIILPIDSTLLSGSASDSDGNIVKYNWTKIAGPTGYYIAQKDSLITKIDSLQQGYYEFELRVLDNKGAAAKDTVRVNVQAQPAVQCNGVKQYIVPAADGGRFIHGDPAVTGWHLPVNPGDTLVLRAQYSWSYFAMEQYSGTSVCPIVIMNEGGQTWLTAGIEAKDCKYLKITGSGFANSFYGIKVYNPGFDGSGIGVSIQGKSRNIEMERVDVYKKTYGVWAKQDPRCDTSYNYPNFVMDSIEIHHMRFKNIGQDCIYAGNTDPTGQRTLNCNGVPRQFIPMRLSNINIHHLIIDSCNRTGIQLSGADGGYNQIHNNIITNCGFEYDQNQGTGISIGGMTKNCRVFNNTIKNTFIYGILSFGAGTNYIENNIIDSSGYLNGVMNTWNPTNILVSPKTTMPVDSTRVIIRNNKIGVNATMQDGNIALVTWGPPLWSTNNVVCSNTRLNGTTPANYFVAAGIHYITDCNFPLPNIAPTAYAGPDKTMNPPADSAMVTGTGADPDGIIVAYKWRKINGPSQFTIVNDSVAQTSIKNLVQGVYTFRLTVTDSSGATGTDDMQIIIAPPNQPPVANAGASQNITLPANAATLSGSGIDADGTITAYFWNRVSGPAQFTISTPSSPQTTITNLVQGIYLFELIVTDNSGATDRDTAMITVNAAPPPTNRAPVANAGTDQSITLPTNFVSLTGSGQDSDGSIVAYSWRWLSGPTLFTINTPNTAQTLASNLVQGIYRFELTVTDNSGATASDIVEITVNAAPPVANVLPTVFAGPDQTIQLPVNSTTLSGVASDADGNIISYLWKKLTGPSAFTIANAALAQTAVSNLVQGVYSFELSVIDNAGATARDTLSITVLAVTPPVNLPPVAYAGRDSIIYLPSDSASLRGSATDADGIVVSYAWRKISGANVNVVAPGQASSKLNGLQNGQYKFELTVTDNSGATDRDTVMITVQEDTRRISTASLYPNPASSEINITIDALTKRNLTTISIYDINGRLVQQEEFMRTEQTVVKQVDVSKLPTGMYVVVVNADINRTVSMKFMKE